MSTHSPLIVLCGNPEDDGWLAGGVNVGIGQLGVRHHALGGWPAVHPSKGHGPWLCSRLGLEAEVH